MPLSENQLVELKSAHARYDFPSRVWNGEHMTLADTREVEKFIGHRLHSGDVGLVRQGLVSVVCWGWGGTPLCEPRTQNIAARLTELHVAGFERYRTASGEGCIRELRDLRLPQLSRMPFSTKVLAFMNPSTRAVMDKKIVEILIESIFWNILQGRPAAYLALVSGPTAAQYDRWSQMCISGAGQMGPEFRAVDFERAIFTMAQEPEKRALAIQCVNEVLHPDPA